jgi:putative MATE family efflux protein
VFERSSQLINDKFKEYLLPTTLSGVSMMLGSIVDGIIVGFTINARAMAAVNVTEPIVLLYQTIFFLFGMGGATLVAICKGQRDEAKANVIYTLACVLILALSVVLILLSFFFLDPMVELICNNAELFEGARSYARVILWGAPFMLFVPGMVFFIRVDGKPKLSANILLVANVVNLIMDLVYIKVFGMGIDGAALATVTGYVVGFFLVVRYWRAGDRTLRLVSVSRADLPVIREIANSGMAGAVNTLLLTVKTLFVNRIVLAVGGADGMAVFAVCNFAISFISMFVTGAADTMVPLVGMLYGEGDWQGIRFTLKRTFTVILTTAFLTVALMVCLPVQILGLFSVTDPVQVALGIPALRIFSFSLVGVGLSYTTMYYLQTTKHRNLSVTISLLRGFVLIIPCVWLLSGILGISGVWWAYVISEAVTILITLLLCWITQSRSRGRYSGIFLFERDDSEAVYDVTVHGQAADAVSVSDQLIGFGRKEGLGETQAALVGLMAEEAVERITRYNAGAAPMDIDVLCRLLPEQIILSFRDNGRPFDGAAAQDLEAGGGAFDNAAVMRNIAEKVDYVRTLGLNNTVVLLDRKELS